MEVFSDGAFIDAFGIRGWLGISPGQLAMVTVLQFAENLTDRQAADSVHERIDWRYCLGLELTDAGFDFSVLSQFRSRLVVHDLQTMAFEMCPSQGRPVWPCRSTTAGRPGPTGVGGVGGHDVHGQLARPAGRDGRWNGARRVRGTRLGSRAGDRSGAVVGGEVLDFLHDEVARTAEQSWEYGVYEEAVPVPDSAPTLARILGLTGRDPDWTAPRR
jgi:hypothetical protein